MLCARWQWMGRRNNQLTTLCRSRIRSQPIPSCSSVRFDSRRNFIIFSLLHSHFSSFHRTAFVSMCWFALNLVEKNDISGESGSHIEKGFPFRAHIHIHRFPEWINVVDFLDVITFSCSTRTKCFAADVCGTSNVLFHLKNKINRWASNK